ncbi:uncharacterized protein LOC100570031 [Acyrthosiphon pisum]|uniref:Uncharacterized protein n=1 Tax=Acyrthosiphon pisum TaxID=7029 RepID=A0A8R2NJ75_ACYPI|nr:uncharacterized protein LOC100570031 [Acyrthosiphon pisum]
MSSQRSEKLSININEESSVENEIVENMLKVDATETATEAVIETTTETATETAIETEPETTTATEAATETATETTTETATKTAIRLKKDPIKKYLDENLKTVFIPKYLHEDFKCTVGTHVFINNPWKKISRKKIIENLQLQKTNSCFWEFRKQIEDITNDDVLVGYKSSSSTDEEFVLCITDKARKYIEEAQKRVQIELEQQVERSMNRLIGHWDPKGSEKDIEDLKPVTTREKIKYKWKIPKRRIQVDAAFEKSNSKSVRNQYVKLKPQSKEIFEMSDKLIMESNIQAKSKTVNREMQTIPKIKDNKCIQSIIEEEQINQPQPIMKTAKVLDDFLLKNVPDVMTQLQYNELYDLYRDDYKQMKDKNKTKIEKVDEAIRIHPGYQNETSQKKYVSSIAWHPTIVGIFAVSYMSNSNELVKQVSLENTDDEPTESNVKDKHFSISYTEDDDQDNWNNHPKVKLLDNNYDEKFLYFLYREFVQKIRILQITEDEKMSQGHMRNIDGNLRQTLIYDSNEQLSAYNELIGEEYNHEDDVISNHTDYSVSYRKITTNSEPSETDEDVCHHDSDTESFYNIWGEDTEWLYNNQLRNVVRNIHRDFNKKYNREAKEEKLFELLMSETKEKQKYIYFLLCV